MIQRPPRIAHPRSAILVLMAVLSVCVCSSNPPAGEDLGSLRKNPSRRLSSYVFNPASSLVSRVTPMPRFLLDDIRKLDGRADYAAYAPSAAEMKTLEEYLALVSPRHRKVMRERLVGIYFISPFMGGGLADWVMDDAGKVYAVLVINPEVFRRSLSDWLTYREQSCYRDDGSGVKVRVDAGRRFNGLMYLLLHEAAHIVDYVENHTPFVEPVLKVVTGRGAMDSAYARGVWEEYGKPLAVSGFSMRDDVTFYGLSGGPKIAASRAVELYRVFSASPFATLYGSQSWAEDFADTFMAYHLAKKLREPYVVSVEKEGRTLFRYSPLESPRVKARLGYLEKLY